MAPTPALLVFLGGMGGSPVEEMVAAARAAATVDSIHAALDSGACDRAVLVVDRPLELPGLPPGVTLDVDEGPFHFGRRLVEVVRRHELEDVIYLGGGSLPLLGAADFRAIAAALGEGIAVTNNRFSSDLVAFPAQALGRIEPPERDNALAPALVEEAGLEVQELPRTVATLFDIDTPTDLAVLALTGDGGERLCDYLASLDLDLERYRRVLPLFLDREAQIVVAGRVGSHVWAYLERETACRVRLFAEERGLEAGARSVPARSLLGFYIDQVGPQRAFQSLAELGDAAFIDTRVQLAHAAVEASRADRFLSDLGRWQDVGEPFLRELTRAAAEAPLPVLLGGHSLVSGGLMALNEFAWREAEA
ncbi:MAG: hypothetical protein WD379_07700 [Dehalococcoidia bacterium]